MTAKKVLLSLALLLVSGTIAVSASMWVGMNQAPPVIPTTTVNPSKNETQQKQEKVKQKGDDASGLKKTQALLLGKWKHKFKDDDGGFALFEFLKDGKLKGGVNDRDIEKSFEGTYKLIDNQTLELEVVWSGGKVEKGRMKIEMLSKEKLIVVHEQSNEKAEFDRIQQKTGDGSGQKKDPQAKGGSTSLPPDVVKTWQDAGAAVGWMRVNPNCVPIFQSKGGNMAGDLPAFRFAKVKAGVLAKLSDPGAAFGLDFFNAPLTDTGLKELANLKSLRALKLAATQVTDAGMKELAGLKNLQTLDLFSTDVTDVGLKELAALSELQSLSLWGTKATDAGMKELIGLKKLRQLNLTGVGLTDVGLKALIGLKGLKALFLDGTQVTDAGLKELAGLKNLTTLSLSFTAVTDAGLKDLAGLSGLQWLDLSNAKVTAAGIATLRKALPACTIIDK